VALGRVAWVAAAVGWEVGLGGMEGTLMKDQGSGAECCCGVPLASAWLRRAGVDRGPGAAHVPVRVPGRAGAPPAGSAARTPRHQGKHVPIAT
jgi:hypothetical protein